MTDTRPKALEKAKQRIEEAKAQKAAEDAELEKPISSPAGKAFQSERDKAKDQLRSTIGSYDGQSVHKIAALADSSREDRILRVAAYCRVSTDDLEQVISIELQKSEYKNKIKANPMWRYAGTYVDDGFSGTNTDHRPGFKLMMKDAMAGKFDMIITKSVSRFARNLVDCINWVRTLKEQDPPIAVYFEQEGLNTLESTSNIILIVLAMVAEEESHMKSEAMLLSLEWRLSRGRFLTPKLLGYDVTYIEEHGTRKKQLIINENEAQTVRLAYYMLLSGSTTTQIAETLTELQRETAGRRRADGQPNTTWTANTVATMLRNERYCGDVLARKTWTPDFHDHKSKKNHGKKNKYYQADHHEAIVTRAQWNAAQRILNSHKFSHTGSYLPMRIIDHGPLTGFISINRRWAGFEPEEYMRVSRIVMGLDDGDPTADLENEHLPDAGHKIAGMTDDQGILRIARELSDSEKEIKAQLEGKTVDELEPQKQEENRNGFQVVSSSMFTQFSEPVVRFTRSTMSFNSTCIAKLNRIMSAPDGATVERCRYVELLFNPVERLLAVRPCAQDHPNAILWADENGLSVGIACTAFSRILFTLLGWDEGYGYRVQAKPYGQRGQKILFFDLDNYIGRELGKKPDATTIIPEKNGEEKAIMSEEVRGIFYPADDDEEPQEIEDIEALEQRLREAAERENRSFGTPLFEHSSDTRFPESESAGDMMTPARVLDKDHRVDDSEIDALQERLMDELFAPAEDPPTANGGEG